MNSRYIIYLALVAYLCMYTVPAKAENVPSSINLLVGTKTMYDSSWKGRGMNDLNVVGLDIFFGSSSKGLLLGIGAAFPSEGSENYIAQVDVAARKYLIRRSIIRPYVSAGVGLISSDVHGIKEESAGLLLNVGGMALLEELNLGLDLRLLFLADGERGAYNSSQLSVQIGF